jgi:hypothetical protein
MYQQIVLNKENLDPQDNKDSQDNQENKDNQDNIEVQEIKILNEKLNAIIVNNLVIYLEIVQLSNLLKHPKQQILNDLFVIYITSYILFFI